MIEHATFADETVVLGPGDRLYCYTDGVIEAQDASEQEFGYARLVAALVVCGIARCGRGSISS
jgi:serine phosphatase RsbU (regulator of sigma subunit)